MDLSQDPMRKFLLPLAPRVREIERDGGARGAGDARTSNTDGAPSSSLDAIRFRCAIGDRRQVGRELALLLDQWLARVRNEGTMVTSDPNLELLVVQLVLLMR